VNNVVAMVFTAAGVMVTKEPSTGLSLPDGIMLIHGEQESQSSGM